LGAGEWQCTLTYKAVDGDPTATDIDVTIRPSPENRSRADLGVAFTFDRWSTANYVFVPAAVYNGNRFKTVHMSWPTVIVDSADRYHDIDPIIPDHVPHLNIGGGPSRIAINTQDGATAAAAFFSPELQKSFLVLVKPTRRFDIVIDESADRRQASFVLSARQETFSISLRMLVFPSQHPIDLLTTFFRVRQSLTEPHELRNTIPFGRAFALEQTLHNTERWDDAMQYYRQGGQHEIEGIYSGVQLGWIGGLIEEQPLLVAGSDVSRTRSVQTIETILHNMQGRSGLMYGIFKDGVLYSDDLRNSSREPLLGMARKNGDALYFLTQNLMILRYSTEYNAIAQEFEPSARRLADGLVRLWNRYGQFGQLFDPETGELVVYGSTSGASIVAGLALASAYFEEDAYLRVAEAAADLYYNRDLKNGYTTGGPGEAMQNPDSESAFALLEALMTLYEITGRGSYLDRAKEAAAYFSSWVTSYDFPFPQESALGRAGIRSTGSVWANTQNKHGAPAMCNFSGDALLRLYRATGDERYLDLLRDIAHNAMQYVSTAERPLAPNMLPGYVNERVNISTWEGEGNVGGNLYGSSPWVEVALMQIAAQVPGIYVDVEEGTVTTFDHVEASVVNVDGSDGVSIRIRNPTTYDAVYSVFVDFDKSEPMGWNGYPRFHKVALAANEERVVTIE